MLAIDPGDQRPGRRPSLRSLTTAATIPRRIIDVSRPHSETLEKLTDEFVVHKFNVKWLLRKIALSATWRRSGKLSDGLAAKEVKPDRYRVAIPRPLSAEQMARSLAEATGRRTPLDKAAAPAKSKFNHKDYINGRLPPPDNWNDVLTLFAATFGHPAGQPEVDFRPSVEQSLFLENDRLIGAWLAPEGDGAVAALLKIGETPRLVEEAYLRFLSRRPTAEEQADAAASLESAGGHAAAVVDLCDALITSAEFRLNH